MSFRGSFNEGEGSDFPESSMGGSDGSDGSDGFDFGTNGDFGSENPESVESLESTGSMGPFGRFGSHRDEHWFHEPSFQHHRGHLHFHRTPFEEEHPRLSHHYYLKAEEQGIPVYRSLLSQKPVRQGTRTYQNLLRRQQETGERLLELWHPREHYWRSGRQRENEAPKPVGRFEERQW